MSTKYLDSNGLLYLWQKIRNTFISGLIWDSTNKKIKTKKKTGTSGAEESTDLVQFAAGSNVILTGSEGTLTIAATDTTYESKSAASGGTDVSLVTTGEKYTWGLAEANVQADWSESSSSSDAYIQNKPTLGDAAAKGVVTAISNDSNDLPTTTAVKNYVASAVTGATAFQGTAPTTFAPTNYKKGYYWIVGTPGTYVGKTCEAGDMIFAVADYLSAYSDSDFSVIQTNLDISSISNQDIDTIIAS